MATPKVSVIIPNYNHCSFLQKRIESVLSQTYSDYELILMDDKSTDDSLQIINQYANHSKVSQILINDINSGNTFKQWNKGISIAKGKYIWIAESDDYADERLLENLVAKLESNEDIGIAYCQSYGIDENNNITRSWQSETNDLDEQHWKKDFTSKGIKEIENYLIYKNTIPNASAVLFRKNVYDMIGGAEEDVETCGDWYVWLKILLVSDVAFIAQHLNYFRKHKNSVIAKAHKVLFKVAYHYDLYLRKKFQNRLLTIEKKSQDILSIVEKNKKITYLNIGYLGIWQFHNANIFVSLKNILIASLFPKPNGIFIKRIFLSFLRKLKIIKK